MLNLSVKHRPHFLLMLLYEGIPALDIPALPPIPLSLSDDWFSHETLSHNGINLPRFSLCAFVYAALPDSGIEHSCRTKAYCLCDILIFSKTWSEHLRHVSTVLETLRANKLFCKPSKCEFGLRDVIFLGHKLSGLSISPDPNKIAAVKEWPAPSSIKEVSRTISDGSLITIP